MNIAISEIPLKIIREQALVIGPFAWEEASKVSGLIVDQSKKTAIISGDANNAIDALVARYERLFGLASHEVCREAVQDLLMKLTPEETPSSLK